MTSSRIVLYCPETGLFFAGYNMDGNMKKARLQDAQTFELGSLRFPGEEKDDHFLFDDFPPGDWHVFVVYLHLYQKLHIPIRHITECGKLPC